MKKLWLKLLPLGATILTLQGQSFTVPELQGENNLIPIYAISGSIAPYVDKDGYVNPIVPLQNIDFGGGLSLPLVLDYSSAVRSPSPEFGQGWNCPLFESKVVDVQENLKKVELLGGKEIYLVYNARTGVWKHFYTDDWHGTVVGQDFKLTYKSGCTLVFSEGLISSLTTPDGRTILWNRSGEKLTSLQESGAAPALKVTYDKLGFASQILLNPDNLGNAAQTYNVGIDLVYAGINKIQCPNGKMISFSRSRDSSLNPVMTWTDGRLAPVVFNWDDKTGKILADGKYTYQIDETSDARTFPRMSRKNLASGTTDTYYFDEHHGTTDEALPDGTQRHIEMVEAPGPNYKKVRLIEDTKDGKTSTVVRRSFDEKGHLLLEAMSLANGKEATRQFVYDDAGRVVSYVWNGKEMWKNVYDPDTGELMERDLPTLGVKMGFEALPGGEVKQSIIRSSGEVASTVLGTSAWQKEAGTMESAQ